MFRVKGEMEWCKSEAFISIYLGTDVRFSKGDFTLKHPKSPACEFCLSFVYCVYVQRLYKTFSYRFGYFRPHRHYPALFGRLGTLSEQYTQNDDAPLHFRSRRRPRIFYYFRQIDFKLFRHIAGSLLHIRRYFILFYSL